MHQVRDLAIAAVGAPMHLEIDGLVRKRRAQPCNHGGGPVVSLLDPEHDLNRRLISLTAEGGEALEHARGFAVQRLENADRCRSRFEPRSLAREMHGEHGGSEQVKAADAGRDQAELGYPMDDHRRAGGAEWVKPKGLFA